MSTYEKLKEWKHSLYEIDPPSDGFDMAYYQGVDVIINQFKPFDGEGDGGITENYLTGIKDALEKVKTVYGDF